MKISTKGHYAVQSLVDIATQPDKAPVSLGEIALRQELSQNYLEQLFVKLRKANLVKSVRGPGGGYLLAKPATQITIGDIFLAVDESLVLTDCVDEGGGGDIPNCSKANDCKTQTLWAHLGQHFNDILYSTTLTNVMAGDYDFSRARAGAPSAI
ncbi:Iron-sulfur cluster regulator IscR [hydrothermal vent metagenome]|uniref:Iron-sulfur cluster regulator IscR n=1 Tax=hydrothermal vent metagenome TaxID=652676 RepID=A0A3B1CE41_9ZZZZ